nr:zeta toxin family protein [Rathayibacter rathayi]
MSDRSVIILIGGQPGAGKTRASEEVLARHTQTRPIPLVGDEFRQFHPAYEQLLATDPANMAPATDAAVGRWVRMAIDYAREHRYSVLVEGTFRRPEITLAEADAFHRAGYFTHVVALAVPAPVSRNSTLHRAVADARRGGEARWTPLDAHERGYAGTPRTIAAAEVSDAVDRITIYNRAGQALYDGHRRGDGHVLDGAVTALEIGRLHPPMPSIARAWLDDLHDDLAHVRAVGLLQPEMLPLFDQLVDDAPVMAGYAFTNPASSSYAHALDRIAAERSQLVVDREHLQRSRSTPHEQRPLRSRIGRLIGESVESDTEPRTIAARVNAALTDPRREDEIQQPPPHSRGRHL